MSAHSLAVNELMLQFDVTHCTEYKKKRQGNPVHPIKLDHELDEMVTTVTVIPWKPQQYRIPKSFHQY